MRRLAVIPRTVVTLLAGFLATLIAAPIVIVIALFRPTSPVIERIIHLWSRTWLLFAGCPVEVEGRDRVDRSRSYVVVANHLSAFDIMTCFIAVPAPIRYLAKTELFKIPILAQAMRAIGIVEVDRAGRNAIHAAVNRQAKELVESGRSLIIFPEGTRSRDGRLRAFKKGAFTMAIAGQLPVLPVTLHGTHEAWTPATPWIRGGRIKVVIDEPMETEGLTHSDTTDLRDRVRELVAKRFQDMGGTVAPLTGAQS